MRLVVQTTRRASPRYSKLIYAGSQPRADLSRFSLSSRITDAFQEPILLGHPATAFVVDYSATMFC